MYLSNLEIKNKQNLSLYVFYGMFILFCFGLIFVYPVFDYLTLKNDTHYFRFVEMILNSTKWLYQLDFSNATCDDGLTDITTYRSIGYPLITALFKLVFDNLCVHAILVFQVLLWCYSSWVFWNFLDEFGFVKFFKWIFILSYLTGFGFVSQFMYCTDAIFTSIFTILIICCAGLILKGQIYIKTKLLEYGTILLCCFLIRESTLMLAPIFISMWFLDIKNICSKNKIKETISRI